MFRSGTVVVVSSMHPCCLASLEAYIENGGKETPGAVVRCLTRPRTSEHVVVLRDEKWRGPLKVQSK